MRQDQFESLQALGEKLLDVFIGEANPDTWPGAGKPSADLDRQTRGDRVWTKRDAAATLAVVQRISHLVDVVRTKTAAGAPSPDAVTEGEEDLEAECASAEKEAADLMDKITRRRGKP